MKTILTVVLILLISISYSQTIEELEYELSYYKSGEEWGEKKDVARELLYIDALNSKAINYLVEVFGRNDQKDSIRLLFEHIIKDNPNNPEPYLLRAGGRNPHFEGLSYTKQINFLKEAFKIDSTNTDASYMLGKKYYELFLREYAKNRKKANLTYYARNSISYFTHLCSLDKAYRQIIRFPLIQLSTYLKDYKKIKEFKSYDYRTTYFPVPAFSGLPNNWESDYSVDVVWGIESAVFRINWYSSHLIGLEEQPLRDSLEAPQIYRFTWLRSFHNPMAIRIENINDTITIYWKVNDGAGGYEPGKIIENKSKVLSLEEWNEIEDRIKAISFWNIPSTEDELFGTDGAQWILEGFNHGKYHIVDRWCGGEIGNVCMKLLGLTDLIIDADDIY